MDHTLMSSLSFLEPVNTPFSLSDAAAIFERSDGTELIQGARHNCTSVYSDLDQVFVSAATFLNCLSLPTLSSRIQENLIRPEDQELLDRDFGIVKGDNLGSAIVADITGCFAGYLQSCQNETFCGDAYREIGVQRQCQNFLSLENGTFPISRNGSYGTRDCIDAICSAIIATASTDIVGIGVRIRKVFYLYALRLRNRFSYPISCRQDLPSVLFHC